MSRPSPLTFLKRGVGQLRAHGPGLLWWRYVRRRGILNLPPLACPPDAELEVHMQICARDWLNGHWTLLSFARFGGVPFRLVVFDDGRLPEVARRHYQHCFPGVIFPRRNETAELLRDLLAEAAPTVWELWRSGRGFTLPKVLDSAVLARRLRVVQLDPDVLFFDRPEELLAGARLRSSASLWNVPGGVRHADGMFTHTPAEIMRLTGLTVPVPFQVGLGVWTPSSMPWAQAETLLAAAPPPEHLLFMLDQTLLALHAATHGWKALPIERYAIKPVGILSGVVARHYFSKTRDLMYVEGMRTLVARGFLRSAHSAD